MKIQPFWLEQTTATDSIRHDSSRTKCVLEKWIFQNISFFSFRSRIILRNKSRHKEDDDLLLVFLLLSLPLLLLILDENFRSDRNKQLKRTRTPTPHQNQRERENETMNVKWTLIMRKCYQQLWIFGVMKGLKQQQQKTRLKCISSWDVMPK